MPPDCISIQLSLYFDPDWLWLIQIDPNWPWLIDSDLLWILIAIDPDNPWMNRVDKIWPWWPNCVIIILIFLCWWNEIIKWILNCIQSPETSYPFDGLCRFLLLQKKPMIVFYGLDAILDFIHIFLFGMIITKINVLFLTLSCSR